MGVGTGIVIIVGLVLAIYILGLGGDFFNDVSKTFKTNADRLNDPVRDPDVDANKQVDTNTNVCDLRIEFVGMITSDKSVFNFDDKLYIWMGEQSWSNLVGYDPSIIKYQWYCSSDAGFLEILSWHSQKMGDNLLSIYTKTEGQDIRFKFEGYSMTNQNKRLTEYIDTNGDGKPDIQKQSFQNERYTLPKGGELPMNFKTSVTLKNVTLDDYDIQFKSDDFQIGIDKRPDFSPLGTIFHYDLYRPSK